MEMHTESSADGCLTTLRASKADETSTRIPDPILRDCESSVEPGRTTSSSKDIRKHVFNDHNKITPAVPPVTSRTSSATYSTPLSANVHSDCMSQASTAVFSQERRLRPGRPSGPTRHVASGCASTPTDALSMEEEDIHRRAKKLFREKAKKGWLKIEERKQEEMRQRHSRALDTQIHSVYPYPNEGVSRQTMNLEDGPSDSHRTSSSYSNHYGYNCYSSPYALATPWQHHIPYIPSTWNPLVTCPPAFMSGLGAFPTTSVPIPLDGGSPSLPPHLVEPILPSPASASLSSTPGPKAIPSPAHAPDIAPSLDGTTQPCATAMAIPEPSETTDPIELVEAYLEALKEKKEKELNDASRILSWINQHFSPPGPPDIESLRDDDKDSVSSGSRAAFVITPSEGSSSLTQSDLIPTIARADSRTDLARRQIEAMLLDGSSKSSMRRVSSDTALRSSRTPHCVPQAGSIDVLDCSRTVSDIDNSNVASTDVATVEDPMEKDELRNIDNLCLYDAAIQHRQVRSNQNWITSMLARSWRHLKTHTRQPHRPGTQRLEWTCECGEDLFADFPVEDLKTLLELREFLTNTGTYAQTRPNGNGQSQADLGSGSQRPIYALHRSSQKSLNSISTITASTISSRSTFVGSSASQNSMLHSPSMFSKSRYLEICVNVDNYETKLVEIQIDSGVSVSGNTCTDALLFRKIYDRYFSTTKSTWHKFIYRPTGIRFVHFGVQADQGVNFFSGSPLPPEDVITSKKYEYNLQPPVPLPIDSRTFLHYFWKHGKHSHSTSARYMNRLPKKLGDSLIRSLGSDELREGWGIHILEGPNKPAICWTLLAVLVGSFGIALAYDLIMKNGDSGFGIGQWMVAALTAALSALYFSLEDEVNTTYD